MPLDSQWVDRIHTRLLARYGARWVNLWASVDPAIVKADWAHHLDGLTAEQIAYGLENLDPVVPPTCAQFRMLCFRAHPEPIPALSFDRGPIPPAVAAELSRIGGARERVSPKEWARALRDREQSGEQLSKAQKAAWRAALRVEF